MNYILEAKDLRKEYPGKLALRGLNLQLAPGEVFCLLGQNGAGKSTTINLFLQWPGSGPQSAGNKAALGLHPRKRAAVPTSDGARKPVAVQQPGGVCVLARRAARLPAARRAAGRGRSAPGGQLLQRHAPEGGHRHRGGQARPGAAARRAHLGPRPQGFKRVFGAAAPAQRAGHGGVHGHPRHFPGQGSGHPRGHHARGRAGGRAPHRRAQRQRARAALPHLHARLAHDT
uniref:ABC transporter domain-containing protein n=1 Tax=Tanacetum cinerariifolium TaxID=118510 RepID=A0A699QMC1_TANCI|nr:hypothetical protein [Tanacetum cinerariifolium]